MHNSHTSALRTCVSHIAVAGQCWLGKNTYAVPDVHLRTSRSHLVGREVRIGDHALQLAPYLLACLVFIVLQSATCEGTLMGLTPATGHSDAETYHWQTHDRRCSARMAQLKHDPDIMHTRVPFHLPLSAWR